MLNGDGKCEALTDIVLTDSVAFNIPASFNLGERNISLALKLNYLSNDGTKEWKGLVLPFAPTRLSDGKGNDYTIGTSGQHTVSVLSFNDNGTELESHTMIEANKPYMIHLNGELDETVDFTFSAGGSSVARTADDVSLTFDVPLTPEAEAIMRAGKDYTLLGSYVPVKAASGTYLLDEEGQSFNRIADEDTESVIAPFSVYAKANTPEAAAAFEVGKADVLTGIYSGNAQDGSMKFYKDGTNLVIVSPEKRDIKVFTLSGICAASLTVKPGVNTISLSPGIYVVDGLKIIF